MSPDGRSNLDSGVMNLVALDAPYGEEAGKVWVGPGLKDCMQAIITHEDTEHRIGSHLGALATAPDTDLPIRLRAREISSGDGA